MDRQRRALRIALAINAAYMGVEIAGGVVFGSLALLADAAHMLSDVAALGIALIAQRLALRPATARHTYGLQRTEVLGAQANALLLIAVCAWIVYEAVRRLGQPPEVVGTGVLAVATVGLSVNVVSAVILKRAAGRSLNMHAVVLHMLLDAAGSVAAIGAGLAILLFGATWVDPAASLVIVVLVLLAAGRLLRDTTGILMEAAPRGLDPREIERFITDDSAVEDVHHVHVWNLASDVPALSAHVVIGGPRTLHEAQLEGDRLRTKLHERFGIEHTTFELECHSCDDEGPTP